ncbi:MAG: hypothetical protein HOI95_22610 [Chromatiales bacterium]|nr:hypothetical protein [Chromatiales bacterium]
MSSPQGFSTRYSRTYIDQAANLPDGKPLSCAQQAALNALVEVAEALSFDMRLKVGDIQYLNNHVILHGRTAFTDADADAGRLLYRVWLSTAHGDGPWSA